MQHFGGDERPFWPLLGVFLRLLGQRTSKMLGVTVPFLFVWSRGKLFHGANATLATRSLCSVHLYDHLFLLRVVAMMAEEGELGGIDGDGWRKKKDEDEDVVTGSEGEGCDLSFHYSLAWPGVTSARLLWTSPGI